MSSTSQLFGTLTALSARLTKESAMPTATSARMVVAVATAAALVACSHGSGGGSSGSGTGTCPEVVAAADSAVAKALDVDAAWTGPTTGPAAAAGKTIIFVAQTLANPGVVGAAKGVEEAVGEIGWNVRVIDGRGEPTGIAAAMSQAVTLDPDGIVIGGFDPVSVSDQVSRAAAAGIPVIGWHAMADPGPSEWPKLFTNVTTRVEDVAMISAQYVISRSKGAAGVVLFTDDSIPFAADKTDMIELDLAECSTVKVLDIQDIPIPDAPTRTPEAFSSLAYTLGDEWTYSIAINDLYFDNAATSLRVAGKSGDGAPFNIGAGDGSRPAFQRIGGGQFQSATVPEPLREQGWQIVDEFNRAFNGQPASLYVPPIHITDRSNVAGMIEWDPGNGYRGIYRRIWGFGS
jgi:ribose transport system substrate-binding protein